MSTSKQINVASKSFSVNTLKIFQIVFILVFGVSCSTVSQPESLSKYYWEVQQLRLQAGNTSESSEAWLNLGIIYLRTGNFEDARFVLSRALEENRSESKIWFYAGLSNEMLGQSEAALNVYEQAPTLSSNSLFSRATKGRISWLRAQRNKQTLDELFASGKFPETPLSPESIAVLPVNCIGRGAENAHIGIGFSEIISRNLERLQNIEPVDPAYARMAYASSIALHGVADSRRAVWVGRALRAGKVIEGTCSIDLDDRIEVDLILSDLIEDRSMSIFAEGAISDLTALEKNITSHLIDSLGVWVPNRERRIPGISMSFEAFLAYSQGLAFEDAGELDQSLEFYDRAMALSSELPLISSRKEFIQNKLLTSNQDREDLIDLLVKLEASDPEAGLLDMQLQLLGRNINIGVTPGQDTRKLPPGNIGELPAPPRPTGN